MPAARDSAAAARRAAAAALPLSAVAGARVDEVGTRFTLDEPATADFELLLLLREVPAVAGGRCSGVEDTEEGFLLAIVALEPLLPRGAELTLLLPSLRELLRVRVEAAAVEDPDAAEERVEVGLRLEVGFELPALRPLLSPGALVEGRDDAAPMPLLLGGALRVANTGRRD
jgi:hypothetical protein